MNGERAILEVISVAREVEVESLPLAPGTVLELSPRGIVFGRAERAHSWYPDAQWVRLSCPWVGRAHTAIVQEGHGWRVLHSGTTQPTMLNDAPVWGGAELQDGDRIGVAHLEAQGGAGAKTALVLRFRSLAATPASGLR